MNELMKFESVEFGEVRVINIDGEGWLVGKDVVEILGYDLSKNTYGKYVKRFCDEEDYILIDSKTQVQNGLEFDYKQLGQRGGYLVNESGLYSLVFGSDLPEAKKFKRWVTSEVLPQIRQTGGYIPVQDEDDEATIMAKALLVAQKTIERKQELINQQQQVIEEQKPKVESYEQFMETENGLEWDTVAKNLGIGRNIMLRKLRELKILQTDVFEYKGKTYTGDSHNVPYQQYMKYFEVKYVVKESKRYPKVLVLPTGQEYIRKRLSEE